MPKATLCVCAAWRARIEAALNTVADPTKRGPSTDIDPVPFHVANVVLHALASALVCVLAYHMFAKRMQLLRGNVRCSNQAAQAPGSSTAAPAGGTQDSSNKATAGAVGSKAGSATGHASGSELRQRRAAGGNRTSNGAHATEDTAHDTAGSCDHSLVEDQEEGCEEPAGTNSVLSPWLHALLELHVPSWFTGLAFALHPVHTEAVAGVVGHAEVLCAVLSILALLAYCSAADGDAAAGGGGTAHATSHSPGVPCEGAKVDGGRRHAHLFAAQPPATSTAGHGGRVAVALTLSWAAALSKEIGITIIGAMLAYDVLLVPLAPHSSSKSSSGGQGRSGGRMARYRKWVRMGVAAAAAVGYVRMRSLVAVDHLVRIYRKVV